MSNVGFVLIPVIAIIGPSCSLSDEPAQDLPQVSIEAIDDRIERVSLLDDSKYLFRFVDDPSTVDTSLGAVVLETVRFKENGCVAVEGSAAIWPPGTRFGLEGLSIVAPGGALLVDGSVFEAGGGHVSGPESVVAIREECDPRSPTVLEVSHIGPIER